MISNSAITIPSNDSCKILRKTIVNRLLRNSVPSVSVPKPEDRAKSGLDPWVAEDAGDLVGGKRLCDEIQKQRIFTLFSNERLIITRSWTINTIPIILRARRLNFSWSVWTRFSSRLTNSISMCREKSALKTKDRARTAPLNRRIYTRYFSKSKKMCSIVPTMSSCL